MYGTNLVHRTFLTQSLVVGKKDHQHKNNCIYELQMAYGKLKRNVTPNFKDKIECTKLVCAQESITHTS